MTPRPLISEQSFSLETEFLDKLIENIGYLACIYAKKPEDFVKRMKENATREFLEEDGEDLLAKGNVEKEVFDDKKVSFANTDNKLAENNPSDLINVTNEPAPPPVQP